VRCRKQNGQWGVGTLISTLYPVEVMALTQSTVQPSTDPTTVLLHDQRGGGVKTSFKGDKQGLGSTKCTKKRFAAQQIVMLLGSLAHNVVVWTRRWLAVPLLQHYGLVRMVRDVFHASGFLAFDPLGQLGQIVLNQVAL
jgi:hypothetical protein